MRAEMLHAGGRKDGQTYMTRLTVAFRNFEKAPKNNMQNCSKNV